MYFILQETIKKLKPTSPLKISPTPYKVPANLDMSLIPEIFRNRIIREESDEILVDIDCKIENGDSVINHNSECGVGNVLDDFQDISLSEPQTVDSTVNISNQTVIQPLRVALPVTNSSCDYTSSSSLPVQNSVNHPVLNIKDLEYPTEIFPDKNEENPLDSVAEEKTVSSVIDADEDCLINSLTSDTGLMGEIPPPMLPPPLQPLVVQSGKSESDNQT